MPTFKDPRGREWAVDLTAGDLKRLKHVAGVDLRDALKPGGGDFAECLSDPERFLALMWVVCFRGGPIPDRDPWGGWLFRLVDRLAGRVPRMRRTEFEALFDRDTTVGAVAAVWESVWLFFQGRNPAREAVALFLAALQRGESAWSSGLRRSTELVRAGRTSTDFVNGSAGPSESTTGDLPSAN